MKISIVGLGWFGEALAVKLKAKHEILGTTRSQDKISTFANQNIYAEELNLSLTASEKILSSDVIILNIPPFDNQLAWLKSWPWKKTAQVIFISSTSVYGNLTGTVDESTMPVPDTENAKILVAEENWISSFPVFTIIRFGGLIGANRHPGKILSGRQNVQGGNLPVNLIHLNDCVNFVELVIDKKLSGETFNLVNPEHPSRKAYYQGYCLKHNLALPEFLDSSEDGKIISNVKTAGHYKCCWPLI
jgi:nucleoside-diphosphate-sugar epimerase